jgi:multidrug efflux pump subunit AcrA (membrane-fusion protein)
MKFTIIFGIMSVVLTGVCLLQAQTPASSASDISEPCLLSLEEEVEVASQEEGVLKELPVKEGDTVSREQLLAQIDDEIPKMQLRVQVNKLAVAKEEADNDVKIRYAKASADVAWADWKKGEEANRRMPGAVTQMEMMKLKLTYDQMVLSIEQAQVDQKIAKLNANVALAEKDAAEENLKRRKILSPTNGNIVKINKHVGEWLQKGDRVVRLIRVNPLRAEGQIDIARVAPSDVAGRPATVKVTLPGNRTMSFTGVATVPDPRVMSGRYTVRVNIENRKENDQWILFSGLKGEMTIHLK